MISLFLTLSSFSGILHPYYVSVTEVRINSEQKMINLSCKVFTDDLQDALNKIYNSKLDLMKRNSKCDSLINLYVHERLNVAVGVKKAEFKFIGYEIEEEATWCYFEAKLNSNERSVSIKSTILYDFIESQTNFLHCYFDKEKKSFKLDSPNKSILFEF